MFIYVCDLIMKEKEETCLLKARSFAMLPLSAK